MAQPASTAFRKVWTKSAHRIGSEPAKRAPIAEGLGISTRGTPKPTMTTSHRNSTKAPNSDRHREVERALAEPVQASSATAASASTASQAASHSPQHLQPEARAGRAGDPRGVHLASATTQPSTISASQRIRRRSRRPTRRWR